MVPIDRKKSGMLEFLAFRKQTNKNAKVQYNKFLKVLKSESKLVENDS